MNIGVKNLPEVRLFREPQFLSNVNSFQLITIMVENMFSYAKTQNNTHNYFIRYVHILLF